MTSEERKAARRQRRETKRRAKNFDRAEEFTAWEDVFGFDALYSAYRRCSSGTRWKSSVQAYEGNLAINTRKTEVELKGGTWKSRGFTNFVIFERGKLRHIQSVHISERCIQRSFCDNCLIPILKPHLIYDNGASLKGKGTDFALDRMQSHLSDYFRKHGSEGYIYQFDFSQYFANIDIGTLIDSVDPFLMDADVINVYEKLVRAFGEVGLGLGSQVSQISAIFYPNPIDHLIKDQLGVKHYGRYMDDGYILCPDKARLEEIVHRFEGACARLGIQLNQKKCHISKISRPFTFLKTRFHLLSSGKIVRKINKATARKERQRLKAFGHILPKSEIEANFYAWLMQQTRGNSFKTRVRVTEHYIELYGVPVHIKRPRTRKQKVAAYIIRKATNNVKKKTLREERGYENQNCSLQGSSGLQMVYQDCPQGNPFDEGEQT